MKKVVVVGGGAAGLMAAGGLVLFCFPKGVLGLFDASPALLALGVPAMRVLVLGYPCNGLSTLVATYLQAVGRVRDSMVINLTRQLALLVPMMWLLGKLFGMTGIWAAFPVTEVLTLVLACVLLRRCRVALPQAAA